MLRAQLLLLSYKVKSRLVAFPLRLAGAPGRDCLQRPILLLRRVTNVDYWTLHGATGHIVIPYVYDVIGIKESSINKFIT